MLSDAGPPRPTRARRRRPCSLKPPPSMRIIDLEALTTAPILNYQSADASAASIGRGTGASHVHWLRLEAGGVIGPHPAGRAQLLVPLEGNGWAAGADGARRPISRGQVAIFAVEETHSQGCEGGMTALLIQLSTLILEFR
jgi:hypothetical protein